MSFDKGLYSLINLSDIGRIKASQMRYFYIFCAICLAVAGLEFGQDYISSVINGNSFVLAESISYKLFWLFFIPLSVALVYGLEKAKTRFSGSEYIAGNTMLVMVITLVHLLVFSVVLFGISNLIHEDPWTLASLLYEKLSTRLYIALAIYLVLSVAYFWIHPRSSDPQANQQKVPKTITVKNGKSSVIIDVREIKWIGSDGAYIDIHTRDKKHVTLESLKNIIHSLPDNFKRIHRSTIVNIDRIKELKSRGNGDYDVIMDDQQVLRLSRNYAKPLKGVLL